MLKKTRVDHFPETRLLTFGSWFLMLLGIQHYSQGKSALPPAFDEPYMLSSASNKAKVFAKDFSKESNLDGPGTLLPTFPCRTNL